MKITIPKIGCKFCKCEFFVHELIQYINHLWSFHHEPSANMLKEINEEINRIDKLPK